MKVIHSKDVLNGRNAEIRQVTAGRKSLVIIGAGDLAMVPMETARELLQVLQQWNAAGLLDD